IASRVGPSLGCSIGVAPNALLAKIASKLEKPNGLTLLREEDLPERLYTLELKGIHGIGDRMATRLHRAGVHTVRQLYAQDEAAMYRLWGSVEGARMYHRLRGAEVHEKPTSRSVVGHSHVLAPEMRHAAGVHAVLHRLLQKAAARLRRLGHLAGAMRLGVRYRDRRADGERETTQWEDGLRFQHTQDTLELMRRLEELWRRCPTPRGDSRTPTQVSVSLHHLAARDNWTPSLFGWDGEKRRRLNAAVDALNEQFGRNTVYYSGAHGAVQVGAAPTRIAFHHVPDSLRD
ncbi:MAG: DNA polymerase, partial [Verrucomicrobiota bacterium]